MSVPDYQALMLPLLKRAAEVTTPARVVELEPIIAADLALTEQDRAERLPSGRQGLLHNRLHWAKQYLTRAGLLSTTARGRFEATERGRTLLAENPHSISNKLLARYPEFVAWFRPTEAGEGNAEKATTPLIQAEPHAATPEERIEAARSELEANLTAELLDRVREMTPADFEELIVTLLVRMGYGQGSEEMARALGGSGDGGVDGVIYQDRLGLDRVYIQAKRYKEGSSIGPDAINSFIGALNIKRATKGVFVTASSFTKQAREHGERSTTHVVLVDGPRLAELMARHGVGVVVRQTIEIKAVDEGFFGE